MQLLGGFRLSWGSLVLNDDAWPLRKASALAKLLALAPGHRMHRESLFDVLWPDHSARAAANNLRFTLHAARRVLAALGPDAAGFLRRDGQWVALTPPDGLWTDVEAFTAAAGAARRSSDPQIHRAAVALYRGDLLPEDPNEEWTVGLREELHARYLTLLAGLARLHEARREPGPAEEAWQTLLAAEPAHEEAHVALVRLHAMAGDREGALRQYRRLTETLRTELEAAPDAASEQLHRDILAGRFPPPDLPQTKPRLPSPVTSFVGRQDAVRELRALLTASPAGARLVTLTGIGGSGKTRLALEVAAQVLGHYADGVWFIELEQFSDPSLVPQAVARAAGATEVPGQPMMEVLSGALRSKQTLLVLDGCEDLTAACADLSGILLRSCPGLQVLATSRQPLGVPGETLWPVPPLSLPDVPESDSPGRVSLSNHEPPSSDRAPANLAASNPRWVPPDGLLRSEAVQLFVARARQSQPGFTLTGHNAAEVADISRRLDGLPLAIELAAARLRALSVRELAERLDYPSGLLNGSAAQVTRQRTVEAAVEWSYRHLSSGEQVLFNSLAVFSGGFTVEAVEALLGDTVFPENGSTGSRHVNTVDLLAGLFDKSLVVFAGEGNAGRYHLLETVRQFAAARLAESGEDEPAKRRHAAHFLGLAEEADRATPGTRAEAAWRRLEEERHNLRQALAWTLEHDGEAALRLAGAMWQFWLVRSTFVEGQRWLQAVLDRFPGRSAQHGRVHLVAGDLATRLGDLAAAQDHFGQSLALCREAGDLWETAWVLREWGNLARWEGDLDRACDLYHQALVLFNQVGDAMGIARTIGALGRLARVWGAYGHARAAFEATLATARNNSDRVTEGRAIADLGHVALLEGEYGAARVLLEEGLRALRSVQQRWGIAWTLRQIAELAARQGGSHEARAFLEESLELFHEVGDDVRVRDCLSAAGLLALGEGDHECGVRFLAAASVFPSSRGATLDPDERTDPQPALGTARAAMGEQGYAIAWAEGQAMPPDQAILEVGRWLSA